MEGGETYEKTKYNHFGEGKTISQLTGFNDPKFPIEIIEQNKTTIDQSLLDLINKSIILNLADNIYHTNNLTDSSHTASPIHKFCLTISILKRNLPSLNCC